MKRLNLTRNSALLAVSLVALSVLFPKATHADGVIAVDAGGGISRTMGASSFFGVSDSDLGFGTHLEFSVLFQLTQTYSPFRVFVGAQQRYNTSNPSGRNLGLQVSYPLIRFALPVFWVSMGVSPFVWKRNDSVSGVNGYQYASGSLAFLGDAGFEILMTPEISICAAAGLQVVNGSGGLSPKPALDASLLLRFYFLTQKSAGGTSGGKPQSYEGWRYPFGYMR